MGGSGSRPGEDIARLIGEVAGHLSIAFFFSSRRRHTRCLSDLSSDVCSSDLIRGNDVIGRWGGEEFLIVLPESDPESAMRRSEERRVGKECRTRWWPYH